MPRGFLFWLIPCLGYFGAAYVFLWSIAAAELRFLLCPNGYSILNDRQACRLPAILELAWLLLFGISLAVTILAVRRSRTTPDRSIDAQ